MVDGINSKVGQQIRQLTVIGDQIRDLQTQISTGKKLLRPSDDIIASARIAQLRRSQAANESWRTNLDLSKSMNSQAQTNVGSASDQVARLSELLIRAVSEQGTAQDRATIANEIRNIAATLDELSAVRSSLGEPLFATSEALAVRIGSDTTIVPVPTRAEIFDMGGQSISDIIRGYADAVENDDDAAVNAAIAAADDIVTHFADANGKLGLVAQRIDRLGEGLIARNYDISDELSGLADTDLSEAIAKLNQQTLTLNAAQAAFARINSRTLFDLLS